MSPPNVLTTRLFEVLDLGLREPHPAGHRRIRGVLQSVPVKQHAPFLMLAAALAGYAIAYAAEQTEQDLAQLMEDFKTRFAAGIPQ
jgi:hypothetical protein